MEHEHDDKQTHAEPRPHSPWGAAITSALIVLILGAGGMVVVREQLLEQAANRATAEEEARDKLSTRLDKMQANIDSLENAPKPDAQAVSALETKIESRLTELNTKLDTMATRQDDAEKKLEAVNEEITTSHVAAPPAKEAAVEAQHTPTADLSISTLKIAAATGKPFATELYVFAKQHPERSEQSDALRAVADQGILDEHDVISLLVRQLETVATPPKADDTSLIGKINMHLRGLVSIKKSGQGDGYAELRKAAASESLGALKARVEKLDEQARAPLESWLKQVTSREKALLTLKQLDSSEQ